MNPDKRVWKWSGAVLAVLCSALGLCHFLLTHYDDNPSTFEAASPAIHSFAGPGNDGPAPLSPRGSDASTQPEKKQTPDLGFKISDPGSRPVNVAARFEERESEKRNSQSPGLIDNRQSSIVNSIRPLGVVEKADGRMQAVIQEGEWTRLVEEGEVLADQSRVVKVSAESVEILRPNSDLKIGLARAERPLREETESTMVRVGEDSAEAESGRETERVDRKVQLAVSRPGTADDGLPGMEPADASYHPMPSKLGLPPEARDEPMSIDPTRKAPPTQFDCRGLSADLEPLGRVEHSDGRVEFVVPDGQGVKLTPERPASSPISTPNADPVEGPASPSQSDLSPARTETTDLQTIQNSESPLLNSGQAIGIVEWADGRTRAIVLEANSVEIVDDATRLAEARRNFTHLPSPSEPWNDSEEFSAEMTVRQREDEVLGLAVIESELATRGPPRESEAPLALPEESARGQPGNEGTITLSRAPPATEWEDLPGISSEDAKGRIDPLGRIQSESLALLGTVSGAHAGSVPEIHLSCAELTGQAPSQAPHLRQYSARPSSCVQNCDAPPRTQVLGVVRFQDGRTRRVVSLNDTVQLLEAGDEIMEGSFGENAEANSVIFTSCGSTMTPAGLNSASHPEAVKSHPNLEEPAGSELQTEPRLRDNQK